MINNKLKQITGDITPLKKLIREYNEEIHPCHYDFEETDYYTLDESEIEDFLRWVGEQL